MFISIDGGASVFYYGRPVIESVYPKSCREQGGYGEKLSVFGSSFLNTGNGYCMFNTTINSTSVAITYYNSTMISCDILPYPHEINQNTTVRVTVTNYSPYYSNMYLLFEYFPYCYGNPPCGGNLKGRCVQVPGVHPYCQCRTSGFDESVYCDECLKDHFGSNCTNCTNCHNGTCNDGYSKDGSCYCRLGYAGSDCLVYWAIYAYVGGGFIVIVGGIFVIRYCYLKTRKAKKENTPLMGTGKQSTLQ